MSQAGAATSLTSADVVTSITATAPLTANGVSGTPEVGDVTIAITNPLPLADGGTGSDLGVVDNGVFVTGNTGVTAILANGIGQWYVLTEIQVLRPPGSPVAAEG